MVSMKVRMRLPGLLIPLALALAPFSLAAEVTIGLTLPTLDPSLGPLAADLELESAQLVGEIQDSLTGVMTEKPALMGGMGNAAAWGSIVPRSLGGPIVPSIDFGFDCAIYAEPLNGHTGSVVSGMGESSDEPVGAAVQPFVIVAKYPLDRWFPRYYAGASLGLMAFDAAKYRMRTFSSGLTLGYRFPPSAKGALEWHGVSLECGADFAYSNFGMKFRPGRVSQDVTLDEDGAGPLPSFTSTLSVDPEVLAELKTQSFALTGVVSSGFTVIDAISLFCGAGLTVSLSRSTLSLESEDEVTISGHLADLAQSPCLVKASGTVCSGKGSFIGLVLQGCARFTAGALTISIPVVWSPARSLGTGLFMGVNF
jgi:hypothetical protein